MKLVVMIPYLNGEKILPLVLETIPKAIDGIDDIDIVIVDDGCTDRTVEVARSHGVKHIVRHRKNQGLSRSFRDGLTRSLELGADIIVLTDGDNQYKQECIPQLIQPILDGSADTVIADRETQTIDHFSPMKKFLQKFGTWVLNKVAGTSVPDATSGFRAYSRKAAIQLNVIADYSFATETTIQAAHKRHALDYVVIPTNDKLRESRQFGSNLEHVRKSGVTIIRAFIMYKPSRCSSAWDWFFCCLVSTLCRAFLAGVGQPRSPAIWSTTHKISCHGFGLARCRIHFLRTGNCRRFGPHQPLTSRRCPAVREAHQDGLAFNSHLS